MSALKCDICGERLIMGTGGIAACAYCGMEHSTERVQEKIQDIKNSATIAESNDNKISAFENRADYPTTYHSEEPLANQVSAIVEKESAPAQETLAEYSDRLEKLQKVRTHIAKFQGCIAANGGTYGLKTNGTIIENYGHIKRRGGGYFDVVSINVGGTLFLLKSDGTFEIPWEMDYNGKDIKKYWKDVVAIVKGGYFLTGLTREGTIETIGLSETGQHSARDWYDIVAISADADHTVGLKSDGTVVTVGDNKQGQCNTNSWTDIVAIAASYNITVGLKSDGTVVQVGECLCRYDWYKVGVKFDVSDWSDIVAVDVYSSGFFGCHIIGLKSDGTVVAAGTNLSGQCNTGDWSNIVAIATGNSHTVGLKSDGTVVAVGDNSYGECNTSGWTDIGPVDEKKRQEETMKRQYWQQNRLCRFCGGQVSGMLTKKCKICGQPQ